MRRMKAERGSGVLAVLRGLVWCWLVAAGVAVAADGGFQRGLLFQIGAGSSSPCYLFGTIHSEDPRVLELPSAVQSAFDGADVFVMEAVPDAQAIIQSMIGMVYTDGRTLESVVGQSLYARTLEALAELGMPEEAVKDFKPWAVVTLLSVPRAETGEFLDIRLYKNAVAAGKEVSGLESMEEQLAVFDALSEQDHVALLHETLDVLDQLPEVFESLLSAYLDQDLAGLVRLSDQYLRGSDPRIAERFEEAALRVRNQRMAERMQPHLRAGGCFIAVGALHLPGDEGILERLHRGGYAVRAMY